MSSGDQLADVTVSRLRLVRRAIEFTLVMIIGVALRALTPPEYLFVAGWIGGAIFAAVYLEKS